MDETTELHKTINRQRRARKLIAVIDLLPNSTWEAALSLAIRMDEEHWKGLAFLAGITPPSVRTREFVIDALKERLRIKRKVESSPDRFLSTH